MNLIDLTVTEALSKLKAGEITATQLTRAYLDRIEKYGDELNCYITITPERALADATESDKRYTAGNPRPLEGIPLGIKDLFCTHGIRTTSASKMLENFIPEYESTVSQKLIDAGCVLLGKTNMDEFAMAGTGCTSFFGATINPHKRAQKLSPGGSSSGSVAAVAGGLAMIATGTDTGDSIRWPASLTGLVGMKPTYGLCSRYGCIAYASSLDTPGPIARSVDDCALMLGSMAGHDAHDSTSAKNADEIARQLLQPLPAVSLASMRIGVIKELEGLGEISSDMKNVFNAHITELKNAGAEIVTVSIPDIMMTGTLYAVISRAEASSNLARYDGMRYGLRVDGKDLDDTYSKTRAAGFGDNVKFRLITGSAMLTKDFYNDGFVQATKIRRMISNEFDSAFEKCDFILTPGAVRDAFPLGTGLSATESDVSNAILVSMNLAGIPGCSIPAGISGNKLPLGVQVVGRKFDDVRVLALAKHIEKFKALDNRPTTVMGE